MHQPWTLQGGHGWSTGPERIGDGEVPTILIRQVMPDRSRYLFLQGGKISWGATEAILRMDRISKVAVVKPRPPFCLPKGGRAIVLEKGTEARPP